MPRPMKRHSSNLVEDESKMLREIRAEFLRQKAHRPVNGAVFFQRRNQKGKMTQGCCSSVGGGVSSSPCKSSSRINGAGGIDCCRLLRGVDENW